MTDLISRADAIKAVCRTRCGDKAKGCPAHSCLVIEEFDALPSAEAVDCTDFIEWLVDRVLDETIWEYNSVAYGEIICRKLEKLGVLEVTEEPSYYIRPSAEAVQGYTEWLEKIIVDNEGANEWLCEDTPDLEWCEKNCHYSSIQAECLRHLYEVSKGGDTE